MNQAQDHRQHRASPDTAVAATSLKIRQGDPSAFVISLVDTSLELRDDIVTLASEGHGRAIGSTPGFEGGIVQWAEKQQRVVTYTRWASQRHYLAALHDDAQSGYAREIKALAGTVRAGVYDLGETRTADGSGVLEILADPDRAFFGIWGQAETKVKRDWIIDYNLWETDRFISGLKGFGSVAFFFGQDSLDFAELTSWDTTADFQAAFQDPGFQEHIGPNNHYCEKDNTFDLRTVAVVGI